MNECNNHTQKLHLLHLFIAPVQRSLLSHRLLSSQPTEHRAVSARPVAERHARARHCFPATTGDRNRSRATGDWIEEEDRRRERRRRSRSSPPPVRTTARGFPGAFTAKVAGRTRLGNRAGEYVEEVRRVARFGWRCSFKMAAGWGFAMAAKMYVAGHDGLRYRIGLSRGDWNLWSFGFRPTSHKEEVSNSSVCFSIF